MIHFSHLREVIALTQTEPIINYMSFSAPLFDQLGSKGVHSIWSILRFAQNVTYRFKNKIIKKFEKVFLIKVLSIARIF